MTLIDKTLAFVTSAIIIASTGCGDPAAFEEPTMEGDDSRVADEAVVADDTTFTLEDERELACEAYCEAANSCRRELFPENCVEHCADIAGPDPDEACIAAEIDLLNCYSAARCDASGEELLAECGDALREVRTSCSLREIRREDDEEVRIIRVREIGEEAREVEGGAEETEPAAEPGEEGPAESEDSEPVFELPEIPEYEELPELGPIIQFP